MFSTNEALAFCSDSSKRKFKFYKLARVSTFLVHETECQKYQFNAGISVGRHRTILYFTRYLETCASLAVPHKLLKDCNGRFCEDPQSLLSVYRHLLPVRVLKGQEQNFLVHFFEEPFLLLLRLVQAGQRKQKSPELSKVCGHIFSLTNKKQKWRET